MTAARYLNTIDMSTENINFILADIVKKRADGDAVLGQKDLQLRLSRNRDNLLSRFSLIILNI